METAAKKTLGYLQGLKTARERIVMVTGYDYPTAALEDEAGVDCILVGDSVGTNLLGYQSEREVTMDDMTHHVRAVRRGVKRAYLLADMPYRSYFTPDDALTNARRLLSAGADGVKLEGPLFDVVRHLRAAGIEVCAHLGYTPQSAEPPGYRAKTVPEAAVLINDARALEAAGAGLLVLEAVPEEVGALASRALQIPTIGIGAGRFVDGQVLVIQDLLGITPQDFRHNKRFADLRSEIRGALVEYAGEVRTGEFPAERNVRHMSEEERTALAESVDVST